MSGDVQPRKRRDKKKKKDELEETAAPPPPIFKARAPTPPTNNDDVNIHVYKESSTGGGICAKLVFFILLALLTTLIGLIITEYRGLSDLDVVEQQQETRFSVYFEGWVDNKADDHDDHHIASHDDDHDDEHDDDHDEEHEEDDHDEEHDEDDHDEEHDEHDEEEEEAASEEEAVSEEEEEEQAPSEEEEEPSAQEDEEEPKSSAQEEEEEDEPSAQEDEEDEPSVQEDEPSVEDEEQDASAEEADEKDDSAQDDEGSEEAAEASEEDATAISEEKSAETGTEDEADEQGDEAADEEGAEQDEAGDDEAANNVAVAIRVGVGLAILVVAYVVLVKKWKSDNDEKMEAAKDLSRRNTIVVPPKVEEVEQVIDNDDEDYTDEEVEEEVKLHPKLKQDYQSLRSTYERSLTPESDTEVAHKKLYADEYDDDEDEAEEEDYDDEEVQDEEAVEDEEEVEEEEEPEEEPTSEEEAEMMKKFEAKYGKIDPEDEEEVEEEEAEEEYDEEEEEEEEDEDDHFPWKQKPKPAQTYDSDDDKDAWLSGGAQSVNEYEFENITNVEDSIIKDQLDEAHENIENNAALAVHLFNQILEKHAKSPRALYGKAKSLDNLADQQRSNEMLKNSIASYLEVLKLNDVPPVLYITAAERTINRMRFMGHYGRAISVHQLLVRKFPEEIKFMNEMAVTYLTSNRITEARRLLQDILSKWPNDGFALVHYGFILKVNDQNLIQGIKYLKKGLATNVEGVTNGIFYFHLGDALTRLGKTEEALKVYRDGVKNKVFLSEYQRSLYNVDGLTGRPWWEKRHFSPTYEKYYNILERSYKQIKAEALAILNQKGFFQDEAENLRDYGDWKQFELYARGIKNVANCKKCPFTCKTMEMLLDAVSCRRGQIKFSVMHPGTHVWPHCGPTNCRLRMHLGLKVPSNTFIRVATEVRSWEEGKVLIFDDSFEHEVWHNGTEFRLILIVDIWHPELTASKKKSLTAI